jgi:flagellar biosynthesis/type III secretory pathway M-ring protein FliF/YscJ
METKAPGGDFRQGNENDAKLQQKQLTDARRAFYITTAIGVIAIIVAVVLWLFQRKP